MGSVEHGGWGKAGGRAAGAAFLHGNTLSFQFPLLRSLQHRPENSGVQEERRGDIRVVLGGTPAQPKGL